MSTTLSFLIAAHKAEQYLPTLVRGILQQADDGYPVEIVISPDCDTDYPALLPPDKRIIYSESGKTTGPAVARTRALRAATGSHIILMDADDTISPMYVKSVFEGLARHEAVAVRSVYFQGSDAVKYYSGQSVSLDEFVEFYGSMHAAMPREWLTYYPDVVAEDALAFLVALHRMQGRLNIVNGSYHIRLHEQSFCARLGATFTEQYQVALDNAHTLANDLGLPTMVDDIEKLFTTRKQMSEGYDAYVSAKGALSYHGYVQKYQQERLTDHCVSHHAERFSTMTPS